MCETYDGVFGPSGTSLGKYAGYHKNETTGIYGIIAFLISLSRNVMHHFLNILYINLLSTE